MLPTYVLRLPLLFAPLLLSSCATHSASTSTTDSSSRLTLHGDRAQPVVVHWGGMRQVLRDGHTEGRVSLSEVIGPDTVAVGALAGLAAEITIDEGAAHLAEVIDPDSADGLRVRAPVAGEQATLLVLANVKEWTEYSLPEVPYLAALELSVRTTAETNGIDVTRPFPFRIEGIASALSLHVLNHSCPIGNPNGPKPWTFSGTDTAAVLIGFYAEDSAGSLTHHGQKSHVHALVTGRDVSGHLDEVRLLPDAKLFLPSR